MGEENNKQILDETPEQLDSDNTQEQLDIDSTPDQTDTDEIPEKTDKEKLDEVLKSVDEVLKSVDEKHTVTIDDVYNEIEDEEPAVVPSEGLYEKAPKSLKIVGIVSIVMAVIGIAVLGLCIYFMAISPSYIKDGEGERLLMYPQIDREADPSLYQVREPLGVVATDTDAATQTDAEEGQ